MNFIRDNQDFAKGFCKVKIRIETLWKELATKLNGHGPLQRCGLLKVCGEKKVRHNISENRAKCGGLFNKFVLSPTEDRIAQIYGVYTTGDGISDIKDLGLPSQREQRKISKNRNR